MFWNRKSKNIDTDFSDEGGYNGPDPGLSEEWLERARQSISSVGPSVFAPRDVREKYRKAAEAVVARARKENAAAS